MKIIRVFRIIDPVINILAIISFIFVFCYQIIFINIHEIFPFAHEIGIISFSLTLAYLASYIFYFVVVKLEHYNNRQKAIKVVNRKITQLINTEKSQTHDLSKRTKISFTRNDYSKELFLKIFSSIKSDEKSPIIFYSRKDENTWLEYLTYYANYSRSVIKEIYQFMPYLELDLLIILDELEDSNYYRFLKPFKEAATYTYPDLSVVANFYNNYTVLIKELESYLNKMKSLYK